MIFRFQSRNRRRKRKIGATQSAPHRLTPRAKVRYNGNMIIDFHTHCFPDAVAPRAMGNLSALSQYPPQLNGTLADLKRSMSQAGVDVSVVLNIATNAHQTPAVNDFALRANETDGIVSFGSVHPSYKDIDGELDRLQAAGIQGIKFHPDFQDFEVDDRKTMYPIYEKTAARGFILLFHCGCDLDVRSVYRCTPEKFARVVRDFRGARIVGAHLGGQAMWDDVLRHTVGQDVYLDTSYAFGWLTDEQLRLVLDRHDPDKLLFGTDSPWASQKDDVEMMRRRIADEKTYRKIMGENAARLLRLSETAKHDKKELSE